MDENPRRGKLPSLKRGGFPLRDNDSGEADIGGKRAVGRRPATAVIIDRMTRSQRGGNFMKRIVFASVAAFLLSSPVFAAGKCPEFPKHANMHAAAQDLCAAAEKTFDAIKANKEQLGGHGEQAEKSIREAIMHLEQAAKYANEHAGKAK
jgi:hypothetical protein